MIPNSLERYSLGDRSNLTYANGMKVYPCQSDGSFQILVQPADVPPPKNWTSNWIPGPAGGGDLSVAFRLYVAKEEALNGSWVFPEVEMVDAITENSVSASPSASGVTSSTSSGLASAASEGGGTRQGRTGCLTAVTIASIVLALLL